MTAPRQDIAKASAHSEEFPPLLEALRGLILQARAAYGKRLLAELAEALTREFGKGFDERNLRNMRAFFQQFPNWNALRSELSWTHYRLLLRVDAPQARQWYMQEAAQQNWSTRVLERQIGTLYYERLLSR